MKLISCHIENFGKLSNFDMDFAKDISVICEENGWGKSTLTEFIKVMLYGFENERARDELSNERKKYKPWQGGTYGGSIVIEINEKEYIITRTFGSKEKDDIFELRDRQSNLVSNDYSSDIGEEIFKIDRESFKKTVFIEQSNCATNATDGINAKMGNLFEHTDDINNYETVAVKLGDKINSMSPTRKTGSLYKLKEEIAELKEYVKTGILIDEAIEKNTILRNGLKDEYNALIKEQNELKEKQKRLSAVKDIQNKRDRYNAIKAEYDKRKNIYEEQSGLFGKEVPEAKELDKQIMLSLNMSECSKMMEEYRLSDSENERIIQLKSDKPYEQLEKLSLQKKEIHINADNGNKFAGNNTDSDAANDIYNNVYNNIGNNAGSNKTNNKNNSTTGNSVKAVIIALDIISMIAFIAGLIISNPIVSIVSVIVAIMFTSAAIALINKEKKAALEEQRIIEEEKERINQRNAQIMQQEKLKWAEYELKIAELDKAIARYKAEYDELNRLTQKAGKFNDYKEKQEKLKEEIYSSLNRYGFIPEENVHSQLINIKENLKEYLITKKEYEDAKNVKEEFEKANDCEQFADMPDSSDTDKESMEEVTANLNMLQNKIEDLHRSIQAYSSRIDENRDKRDIISESEDRLYNLQDDYKAGMKKYELLKETKKYLEKAKESFTSKYMEPVMSAFTEYISYMTNISPELFCIDANANITINELGLQRNINALSKGWQDLIGIALRLAFIKVMYKEEAPFIIIDDPFVNLDKEKADAGRKLLSYISENYQVIYFTCNSDRS